MYMWVCLVFPNLISLLTSKCPARGNIKSWEQLRNTFKIIQFSFSMYIFDPFGNYSCIWCVEIVSCNTCQKVPFCLSDFRDHLYYIHNFQMWLHLYLNFFYFSVYWYTTVLIKLSTIAGKTLRNKNFYLTSPLRLFFLNVFLAILESLFFHLNFSINLSSPTKLHWT